MGNMFYMIIITKREYEEGYHEFFKENGISMVLSDLCKGTAQKKTLDYLGIEKTEKIMFHAIADCEHRDRILKNLVNQMEIEVPGNGIAFTIPLESIGGESCLKYLAQGQEISRKEGEKMENLKYSLIIVVADKGSSDTVMEAARSANAKGGTVVQAKGTEENAKERFFGVSIATEKEMIYILAKKQDKEIIMSTIMEKAGMDTDAHAAVFSIPVDKIAGLRSVVTEEA